jgi:hypothetical protein
MDGSLDGESKGMIRAMKVFTCVTSAAVAACKREKHPAIYSGVHRVAGPASQVPAAITAAPARSQRASHATALQWAYRTSSAGRINHPRESLA